MDIANEPLLERNTMDEYDPFLSSQAKARSTFPFLLSSHVTHRFETKETRVSNLVLFHGTIPCSKVRNPKRDVPALFSHMDRSILSRKNVGRTHLSYQRRIETTFLKRRNHLLFFVWIRIERSIDTKGCLVVLGKVSEPVSTP